MEKQVAHLFVFNTLADWETGFAVAGINNPDLQKHPGRYQIQTVGLNAEPITTIGGVTILPDITLAELEPSAMLMPGGEAWDVGNSEILEAAKACLQAGIPVAAICGATAGLAVLAFSMKDPTPAMLWRTCKPPTIEVQPFIRISLW